MKQRLPNRDPTLAAVQKQRRAIVRSTISAAIVGHSLDGFNICGCVRPAENIVAMEDAGLRPAGPQSETGSNAARQTNSKSGHFFISVVGRGAGAGCLDQCRLRLRWNCFWVRHRGNSIWFWYTDGSR